MPAAHDEPFVGRQSEQKEFRAAIQQGRQSSPSTTTFFPHIFVVYAGLGLGKSALLRQFQRIAVDEQLPAQQIIQLNLDHAHYPDAAALAATLADALTPLQASQPSNYRQLIASQTQARPLYNKLHREWQRWTALRGLDTREVDQLLQTRYQHRRAQSGITVTRSTLHGPRHRVTPVAAQTERVIDELGDILFYHDVHSGTWPPTFDELLTDRLPMTASLFLSPAKLGHALAQDLNTLAQPGPLLVLIDGYERAIQHDDWLREELLAKLDNRVLVVLASRVRPPVGYQNLFGAGQANRVCSWDLNQPLGQNEIKDYLTARLGHDSDLAEVADISHGNPLVIAALCDQLQLEGHLGPYRAMPVADTTPRPIQRTIVQRFLRPVAAQHALPNPQLSSLRDRQRIRTLALLLQPDEALVCELWGVTAAEASASMRELARQHSFMFAGCAPYDMSELVRELVREETFSRARHSLEWEPLAIGVRRGLGLAQERAAQLLKRDASFDDPAWRAATLDQLNFQLWLGQSDPAQRLLLKCWIAARFAGADFGDWLLANAAALVPKTAAWTRLVVALRTQDYAGLDRFASLLDPRDTAILSYMQACRWQMDVVTSATAQQLDQHIELLLKGYTADPTWAPLHDALVEARSARGYYRLYELKDYAGALADFSEIVKLRENDPSALHKRGTANQALGQLDAALEDLTAALQGTGAANPAIAYSRGEVNHKLKRLDAAFADFDQALTFCPDDPIVLSARGQVLFEQNKLPEALADLNKALILTTVFHKPDPDIRIERSRILAAIGKTEDALNDIDEAIRLRSDDPIAFKQRGIYQRINDPTGALLSLDSAIKLFQEKPETLRDQSDLLIEHSDALYQRGLVHLSRAEPQAAMDDFDESIRLHDGPDARYERALLWEARAQPPAQADASSQALHVALADLNAASSQRPGHAPTLAKRGEILLQLGQPARALENLRESLSIRPNVPDVLNTLGRTHLRLGERVNALAAFQASLKLDRNQPDALYYRGRIHVAQNALADALRDFDASLKLRPKHAPTLYERGLIYFKQKNLVEAAKDMQAVLAQEPGHLLAHDQRGRIRLARGQAQLAEQDFDAILQQQPDNAEARYLRGKARLQQTKLGALPDLSAGAVGKIRRWRGKLKIEN